jgi:oligoendopeptidase F
MTIYKTIWDFEPMFPGSPEPTTFEIFCKSLCDDLGQLSQQVEQTKPEAVSVAQLVTLCEKTWHCAKAMQTATGYTWCVSVQGVRQDYLERHTLGLETCQRNWQGLLTSFDTLLLAVPETSWATCLGAVELQPFTFHLAQQREEATAYATLREAHLTHALSTNGYQRWLHLRDPLVEKRIAVPVKLEDGSSKTLDTGECWNVLNGGNDALRQHVAEGWEAQWAAHADLCVESLHGLVKGRLALYQSRGWSSAHHELLQLNRMTTETLEALTQALETACDLLVPFYQRKAHLLGQPALGWYDVYAPLDDVTNRYSYEQAAENICEDFAAFSPEMASFAKMTFTEGWVDSETREGKPSYGSAEPFPSFGRAYAIVNWSGSMYNVVTLAHELGHAYHFYTIHQQPFLKRASTGGFEEMAAVMGGTLAINGHIKRAKSKREKLLWVDFKLGDAAQYLSNQLVRFRFETKLHKCLGQGRLGVSDLNQLMLETQQEVFRNSLATYHPHFWASKVQFYLPDFPFYYVSYPLGYLLCQGMLAQSAQTWREVLLGTTCMTTEALAKHYLWADVTRGDFWLSSFENLKADVDTYLALSKEV